MVKTIFNNATLPNGNPYSFLEVGGVENLVVFRTLPFAFRLVNISVAQMVRDVRLFYTENVSREGAKEAITALRDYAMSHVEVWTPAQLQAVAGTQTLFIVYNSETDMKLDFSKEVLSLEQLQAQNEGAEIWVSYDISDIGLITLVNELLNWL
ncbi:hypothetical protein N9878_02520 [bacterium]|nr:hypothetical protein [bacterium]